MGIFFKKDFLVYWRDRKEMMVAFLLPIALILVLGFTLPNWAEDGGEPLEIKAALVVADSREDGIVKFKTGLEASPISDEEKKALAEQAEAIRPEERLTELFADEKVRSFLEVVALDERSALRQLEDGQVDAVLTVPEGYTAAALDMLLLNKGDGAALMLAAEEESLKVNVLRSVLNGWLSDMNHEAAIWSAGGDDGGDRAGSETAGRPVGGIERIEGVELVGSFQYYSLAISIFFALSVATTTASKAVAEKREQVFRRLLLAGARPYRYLSGKAASTFVMCMLQMTALIAASHFLFRLFPGKPFAFWAGMAAVVFMLCLAVAGLSAVYTALLFRMDNADAASGISFILMFVFGMIGGSLVPLNFLPDWVKEIGGWTPNGLALTSLIQWIQGSPVSDLRMPLVYQGLFFAAVMAASLLIFPRRGRG